MTDDVYSSVCSDAYVRYLKNRKVPDAEHREQDHCDQLLFSPASKYCQDVTGTSGFPEAREDTPLLENGTIRDVNESVHQRGDIISLLVRLF